MSWKRGIKGQDYFKPRPCPTCKQMMSREFLIERNKKRGEKIKTALKNADFKGRPRTVDYDLIRMLRKEGYSIKEICEKLSTGDRTVSRGSVQNAFKYKKD